MSVCVYVYTCVCVVVEVERESRSLNGNKPVVELRSVLLFPPCNRSLSRRVQFRVRCPYTRLRGASGTVSSVLPSTTLSVLTFLLRPPSRQDLRSGRPLTSFERVQVESRTQGRSGRTSEPRPLCHLPPLFPVPVDETVVLFLSKDTPGALPVLALSLGAKQITRYLLPRISPTPWAVLSVPSVDSPWKGGCPLPSLLLLLHPRGPWGPSVPDLKTGRVTPTRSRTVAVCLSSKGKVQGRGP